MPKNNQSGVDSATGEGNGGSPASAKEPLLGGRTQLSQGATDDSLCMRQHLRRQLNDVGRIDLSTGEYR